MATDSIPVVTVINNTTSVVPVYITPTTNSIFPSKGRIDLMPGRSFMVESGRLKARPDKLTYYDRVLQVVDGYYSVSAKMTDTDGVAFRNAQGTAWVVQNHVAY